MKMSKKGFQLTEVPTLVIILLVIAVVMSTGATILGQIQNTQTVDSLAYNITGMGLEGQKDLAGWQSTCESLDAF